MNKFIKLEMSQAATLGAGVEAVSHLSTFGEAQILEWVSAGKIKELFPFQPIKLDTLASDTVDEDELAKALAMPLSREQRAALGQSSMPTRSVAVARQPDQKALSEGKFTSGEADVVLEAPIRW